MSSAWASASSVRASPGLHVGGALIGGDGILGPLQLLIGRAQRNLHLGRAVVHRNRFDDLGGMLDVAAFGIEAGQVQHHLFGIGLHAPARS